MENIDTSVLSTSLPAMARSLNQSPIELKLAMTSYLLALAVWLPASGWLADRFGARHVFRLAIVIFAIGSIGCGFSQSIGEIVASRIIQGIGGSMMVPVGRLIVLRSVAKHEIVGAMAWMTIPALVGLVMGPLVGGFITTFFEWRWIFWINIPIAILGLAMATIFVPNIRGEERTGFDAVGFTLTGFGILAFVVGSTALGVGILPATEVLMIVGIGAALLVGYVFHSRRHPNPILDVTLFRIPSFRIALIGGSLVQLGVGGTPFLLPLFLQYGFGMSPFESGAVTFIGAVGAIGMKIVSTPVIRRYGFRQVVLFNAGVTAFFVALPAIFRPDTPLLFVYAVLLVAGFVRALQMTTASILAFVDVPAARMSQATTLSSVFQQVSMSLGITAAAFTIQAQIGPGGTITGDVFFWPFVVLGCISLLAAPFFRALRRDAGHEVSGHALPLH